MMENEIITLKQKCEIAKKELLAISKKTVSVCEDIINVCNSRKNAFGDLINKEAKNETVEICFTKVKAIGSLSEDALDRVLVIYQSVMKYNELACTRSSQNGRAFSYVDEYFFKLANEIGNAFENLFEREIPNVLNRIVDGLDLDNDGSEIKLHPIISNSAKIAISVSKATKFYFGEG